MWKVKLSGMGKVRSGSGLLTSGRWGSGEALERNDQRRLQDREGIVERVHHNQRPIGDGDKIGVRDGKLAPIDETQPEWLEWSLVECLTDG
jgi:hypothetical protein